jgi:hypothetical protein
MHSAAREGMQGNTLSYGLAIVGCLLVAACANPTADDETDQANEAVTGPGKPPPACTDPGEIHTRRGIAYTDNDVFEHATLLRGVDDASYAYDSIAASSAQGDVDWYEVTVGDKSWSPERLLKPHFVLSQGDAIYRLTFRLCAFAEKRVLSCGEGAPADGPNGMHGCCVDGRNVKLVHAGAEAWSELVVELNLETPLADDTQRVFVRIEQTESKKCEPYRVDYRAASPLIGL